MKNQIYIFIALIGMALNFASCSSEDQLNPSDQDSNTIHFEVTVPTGELRTRAYGDGSSINTLKCYVYSVGAEIPMQTENIEITSANGKRGGQIGIDLPSGGTYDFIFLATSCTQDDKDAKIYYNPSERTINLNYDKITGNDEDVDCFFGVLPSISIDKGQSHSVTLRRPFAQLNIGTKDLEEYNTLASSSLKTAGVSVDGIYTSMNVMDGECVGEPVAVSLPAASVPTGQTFPVKDAEYIAMDFFLVKERKNVCVSLTVNNGLNSFTTSFDNIPLQRNYQTNLYGNLLTKENDFKVEINPEFTSSGNKDIDDPWGDYDLVIQLTGNYSNKTLNFYYYEGTERKSINLIPYADANGIVKFSWSDINLKTTPHVYFGANSYLQSLLKFNINKLNITDLSSLFKSNTKLESFPAFENIDTSTITDMSNMFESCHFSTVNLSTIDMSNVTSINAMFKNCNLLNSLDMSGLDTSKVHDMSELFSGCYNLESLDLSTLDTSEVNDMSKMFDQCKKLTILDLSAFDTSKVTSMEAMFRGCSVLNPPNLSNFDTSRVNNMCEMFAHCEAFESLSLNFDTENVEDMSYMFSSCISLKTLDISSFMTSNVTSMAGLFSYCQTLQTIDLSHFDTSNVVEMDHLFTSCFTIQSIDLSSFDTSKVKNMSYMFAHCRELYSVDLSSFNTGCVENMADMFSHCHTIEKLDLSNFDTSKVRIFSEDWINGGLSCIGLFNACYSLKELNISNWDTSNAYAMKGMFSDCNQIQSIETSCIDTSSAYSLEEMFSNCVELKSLDLSSWDTSNVTNMSRMFYCCNNIEEINLNGFKTNSVSTMNGMFYNCFKLQFLDLSSFDMTKVTNSYNMFYGCPAEIVW